MDYEHLARQFIAAVESGDAPAVEAMLTDDVEQVELPNRLMPNGATRDKSATIAAGERGKMMMSSQGFEILTSTAAGKRVVLELAWTGTLAVPLGALPAGGEMKARFAFVIEFCDDKVWRMRNYDCFDPW